MTEQTGPEDAAQGSTEAPEPTNLYTRNPIQVEARQFFRYNGPALAEWCGGEYIYRASPFDNHPFVRLQIPGSAVASDETSWVVKLPDGMFTAVSEVDFQELYTPLYPSPTEDDENERG